MTYRVTILALGFSLGKLMFGSSVRTPLGKPVECIVDYNDFKDRDFEQKQLEKAT